MRRKLGTGWLVGLLSRAKGHSAGGAPTAPRKTRKRKNAHSGWVERPRAAHILIIDDEPQVALALKRVLRRHEVSIVHSGAEAKALLATQPFDVIVSDVMMPEPSGIDLYEELAEQGSPLITRFIFVTGGVQGAKAHKFLSSIPNQRLDKPVDALELELAIARVLHGAEAGSMGTG